MPFKSKAQAAYMHAAAARGDIPKSVVSEFDKASRGKMKKLPQHVKTKQAAHHATDESRKHSDGH